MLRSIRFWMPWMGLIGLLHLKTFFVLHQEGDELAYLGLAQSMDWFFGGYSTASVPGVSNFHLSLYRAPVFIHPPAYPYLLKLLSALGDPVVWMLVLQIGVHLGIVYSMVRLARDAGGSVAAQHWLAAFGSVCPILLHATTKLHIDGWYSLGVMLTLMALQAARSPRSFLWAGVLFGVTLNTKFLAPFTALPMLGSFFWSESRFEDARSRMRALVLFWGAALVLGLPHFMRLIGAYGPLGIGPLLADERPLSSFVQMIRARTLPQMILYLIALVPLVSAFFRPRMLGALLREFRERSRLGFLVFGLVCLVLISLLTFKQERYWSLFMPLLYVTSVLGLEIETPRDSGRGLTGSGFLSFCFAISAAGAFIHAGYFQESAIIRPVLAQLIPYLGKVLF